MGDRILRPVGSITFAANQTGRLTLIQQNPIVGLHLDFDIQVAITGDLTLRDESILNVLQEISVFVNDQPVQRWPARMLLAYNYFMGGVVDEFVQLTPLTAAGSPGNGRVHLFLPFILPGTGLPLRSLLPSKQLDSLRLEIAFGAADQSDIASAGAGTITAAATTVQVSQEEIEAADIKDLGAPFERVLVNTIPDTFGAANTEAIFGDGIPKPHRIRGLLLRVSDLATGLALSDTLITGVRVENSQPARSIKFQSTWERLKHLNLHDHRLAEDYALGTPGAEAGRIEGYAFIDFGRYGPASYFDPRLASRSDLVLNTLANSRVDMAVIQVTEPLNL